MRRTSIGSQRLATICAAGLALSFVAISAGCGQGPVESTEQATATTALADSANGVESPASGDADEPVTPSDEFEGDWPLSRVNAMATGVSQSGLPERLELLWKVEIPDGMFEATPIIIDGTIYLGCLDGFFYAFDLLTGEQKWKFPTDLGFRAAAAYRDGAIYVGDEDGRFFCIEADSGEMRWVFETLAEIDSGANFHGTHVLFGSQDATLYCLEAEDGAEVWRHQIEDQIRCSPTIVEDRAFLAGCDGMLHIVNLSDGERIAAVEIDGPTGSTPAVMGTRCYFGTEGETFFAIDWQQAEIAWSYRHPQRHFPIRSSAAVAEGGVYFGGRDKLVHALNPESGEPVWEFPARARVDSSPILVGDRLFAASADGSLYEIDTKTGEQSWLYEAGGGFTASPAVADGRLVIGNDDGVVFCFGAK